MIVPTFRHADPWGPDVIAAIQQHGMNDYPYESCGYIADDKYHPCLNIHTEPAKGFKIDPAITGPLLAAGKLQAIVHSHPDGPNFPSVNDQQGQIDTDVIWGIVPVLGDEVKASGASDIIWWGEQLPIPPYEGRKFIWGVMHCYQLYRDWLFQERGHRLPNFAYDRDFYNQGHNPFVEFCEFAGMTNLGKVDISDLQVGDMLLGHVRGSVPNHCAVFVGNDLILHHPPGGVSRKDDLLRWWPLVDVVFRYVPTDPKPSKAAPVRRARKKVRQEP